MPIEVEGRDGSDHIPVCHRGALIVAILGRQQGDDGNQKHEPAVLRSGMPTWYVCS
jgi:hypothetical protein